MIICPSCRAIFPEEHSSFACSCGFQAIHDEGVSLFYPDYELSFRDHTRTSLQNLTRHANHHFWMISRRKIVVDRIMRNLDLGDSFLEVGAGAADISECLQNLGLKVTVSDIQTENLKQVAKKRFESVVQFDLYQPIFREHFDSVGAFCVIEHLEEDLIAAKHLVDIVKPGGLIFIMVPAHDWLWNNRDRLESHKRRYSKRQLSQLFESAGASVLHIDYLFFSILPLLAARSLIDIFRKRYVFTDSDILASMDIHPALNLFLTYLMKLEMRIFKKRSPPIGGSLLLTAQKN